MNYKWCVTFDENFSLYRFGLVVLLVCTANGGFAANFVLAPNSTGVMCWHFRVQGRQTNVW